MIVFHIGRINQNNRATGPDQSIRALTLAQSKLLEKVVLIPCFPIEDESLLDVDPNVYLGKGPQKKHLNPWYISKQAMNNLFDKHGKPDLVNFHGLYSPFSCAFAMYCKKINIPYIITPRGEMTPLGQSTKKIKKTIANFLCFNKFVKNASAIQALTKKEAFLIKKSFSINNIFVCSNGVSNKILASHTNLKAEPLDDFLNPGDLCVGYIGRIDIFQKGIDVLLKSFSILNSFDANIKLVVIGPFRTNKDEVTFKDLVDIYNLHSVIRVLKPKFNDEKFNHLLSFDLFIHTSRFEGMPMAILEAMAMKKPCLVTPGTNVEEMVIKGDGWKCNLNSDEIAQCLLKINKLSKSEIIKRGQKSYSLVKDKYTWKDVATCNIENYKKVLSESVTK